MATTGILTSDNHRELVTLGETCLPHQWKCMITAKSPFREVWTLKKLIIQGGAFKLGCTVKQDSLPFSLVSEDEKLDSR